MISNTEPALNLWGHCTQAFLSSQGWHPGDDRLLLAVSGGADSIALLHWARRATALSGGSLAVAHVHHGLRPSATGEQDFVAALCRDMEIPFLSRSLNPASRPPRESVEMWARRERYAFFAEAAAAAGARWILTGHHRDDLVETVFQRLGRGTGPRGLKGIPFRRGNIVRPFLNRSRAQILDYLRLCGASWREDESNADIRIDRNGYRHRYLPALRSAEPDLDARILAMALRLQSLGDGIDRLEGEAGWLQYDGEAKPFLSRAPIAAAAAADDWESLEFWLRKLLRAAIPNPDAAGSVSAGSIPMGHAAAPSLAVTKGILQEFRRQWRTDPVRLRVPLSATAALKCENGGVYCVNPVETTLKGVRRAKKGCSPQVQRVILNQGCGEVSWQWGNRTYTLAARRYSRPRELEFPEPWAGRAIFDAALFSCTLEIRTREDGDRFSPLGLQSRSRKLKTFFNEEKVPIGVREILPLVLGGRMVAWVPGHGISDFFKVSGSTSHILELVLKCENL